MSRSFSAYYNTLQKLESFFDLVFMVENNEDLNKIHFCFKTRLTNQDYLKIYQKNFDNFSENGDLSIIEGDYKKILSKVVDVKDMKEELKHKI